MSETIKTLWLKDVNQNKIAPKTLSSQIITDDGQLFENVIENNIDNIVQEQLTAFEERILPRMTKINLPVSGWDTNALTQTVAVNGISADETSQLVTTCPIGDSISPAIEAGVYCKSQGENQLTFSCLIQPTYDIDCMVTWQNVVYIPPTHTVTFYNDDGSVILYRSEVNEGSDATYVGDIPAKESDGVYDYNFIGWSLTIGGDIDESALVNVTANRNVYAVFEKTEIEVVSGGWVPFCADGVTWMGEQVTEAKINTKPVIITDVVLSETNQYRLTVDGTEYICIRNEENDGYSISCDGCPVIINYDESLGGWYFADDDSDTRFSGTLKVESWTGSEPYVPEEPETDTNWVLLCADGATWSGEEVSNNAMLAGGTFETIDLEQVVTNQYRLTVDGTAYLCVDNGTGGSSYVEGNAVQIEGDGCPATITAEDYSFSPWIVTFNDGNAHTLKVEVWIGSEPYVPEEEGYVPTDGYQAFTTDGTWTGEEVTTAVSVPDFTNYKTSFPQADIQWNGAPSATISNDTVVLIWVDNVCYTCSATVVGNPKSVYCFTCDGCPAAVMGGLDVGNNNWRVAFTTAGTYKLKVEVLTNSEPNATFIPMKDLEIASGSFLNFQVHWGRRPYEEFEGYLDGNTNIAAYSYYDGRARGYVVRLKNNGDADLTVSSDVTYTIIITNVIVE